MGDTNDQSKSPFGNALRKDFLFDPDWLNMNHGSESASPTTYWILTCPGSFGTIVRPVRAALRGFQDRMEARPDAYQRYEYPALLDEARAGIAALAARARRRRRRLRAQRDDGDQHGPAQPRLRAGRRDRVLLEHLRRVREDGRVRRGDDGGGAAEDRLHVPRQRCVPGRAVGCGRYPRGSGPRGRNLCGPPSSTRWFRCRVFACPSSGSRRSVSGTRAC